MEDNMTIPPHGRELDRQVIGNCTSNKCEIRGRCTYPDACRRTDLGLVAHANALADTIDHHNVVPDNYSWPDRFDTKYARAVAENMASEPPSRQLCDTVVVELRWACDEVDLYRNMAPEVAATLRALVDRLAKAERDRDCALIKVAELTEDVQAADERLAGVLDGTFAVGDGTAQREIERLRAEVAACTCHCHRTDYVAGERE